MRVDVTSSEDSVTDVFVNGQLKAVVGRETPVCPTTQRSELRSEDNEAVALWIDGGIPGTGQAKRSKSVSVGNSASPASDSRKCTQLKCVISLGWGEAGKCRILRKLGISLRHIGHHVGIEGDRWNRFKSSNTGGTYFQVVRVWSGDRGEHIFRLPQALARLGILDVEVLTVVSFGQKAPAKCSDISNFDGHPSRQLPLIT